MRFRQVEQGLIRRDRKAASAWLGQFPQRNGRLALRRNKTDPARSRSHPVTKRREDTGATIVKNDEIVALTTPLSAASPFLPRAGMRCENAPLNGRVIAFFVIGDEVHSVSRELSAEFKSIKPPVSAKSIAIL